MAASTFVRRLTIVARILLGLPLFIFGLNFFFNFMPQPKMELPAGAVAFSAALMNSGYMMQLIGTTFLIVGAFLLINRFVPLALAFLRRSS